MNAPDRQSIVTDRKRDTLRMPRKAPKPRKPTHQDRLEAAIGKEIEFQVALNGVGTMKARLVEVDQFTITVDSDLDKGVVYFKSALAWFQIQG